MRITLLIGGRGKQYLSYVRISILVPWNGSYPPVKLFTSLTYYGVGKGWENSSFRRRKYFGTRGLIILQLSCYYHRIEKKRIESDKPVGS